MTSVRSRTCSADAVRLALKVGDKATAQTIAGQAAALADGSQIPHRQANALYCRGMVDGDASMLLDAAQRYADAGRPLPRAKALEAAAECLVRADERTAARQAFEQAVEVYEFLGAEADINRIQAEFRAHGIRRGPHSKHRRAVSGWDSLTDTELKVAAFVEEGLSNPDIAARLMLSRRTVATHVSHILEEARRDDKNRHRAGVGAARRRRSLRSRSPRGSPRPAATPAGTGTRAARRVRGRRAARLTRPSLAQEGRGRVAAVVAGPRRLVARHHHVHRLRTSGAAHRRTAGMACHVRLMTRHPAPCHACPTASRPGQGSGQRVGFPGAAAARHRSRRPPQGRDPPTPGCGMPGVGGAGDDARLRPAHVTRGLRDG